MRLIVVAVACLASFGAYAQIIPSSEDGVHLQLSTPQTLPSVQPANAAIKLESTSAPNGAASIPLAIASVKLAGSTIYTDQDINAAVTAYGGATSLLDVYELAEFLTAKYREDGYILSRVIVPPQRLDPNGASIVFEAIEGYIDRVEWPEAVSRFGNIFSDYSTAITSERPTTISTLERYLLLAGDLPGLSVTSRLEASDTNPRASTLFVEVSEAPFEGSMSINNFGSEGRGPYIYSTRASLNNLLDLNEQLTLSYSGSLETKELQFLSTRYSQTLNSEGLTGSVEVNYSAGAPGTATLQTLMFESRSLSFVVELVAPIIRSREKNLSLYGQAFLMNTASTTLGLPFNEDRLRGMRAGLRFNNIDTLNGYNQATLQFSKGFAGLGSTLNNNPLASRANGQVDFSKINFSFSRIQNLFEGFSIMVGVQGQYAFTPLLSPEECSYGGQSIGRAFDGGTLAGDSCLSAIAELRYNFPSSIPSLTSAQIYTFADIGKVWRISPATGTPSNDAAASAGLGLRTVWLENTNISVEANKRIWGSAGVPDWQFNFDIGQGF